MSIFSEIRDRRFALAALLCVVLFASAFADAQNATERSFQPVPHPAYLLDSSFRESLVAKARAKDPTWTVLKDACDAYSDTVLAPDNFSVRTQAVIDRKLAGKGAIQAGYQGTGYLAAVEELGLCYQMEKALGHDHTARHYGQLLTDVLRAISDPRHQIAFNAVSVQVQDSAWTMKTYTPALAIGYDLGHDLLGPELKQAIFAQLESFLGTWTRGYAYPTFAEGKITGAVLLNPGWRIDTAKKQPTCSIEANGSAGSGATCHVALDDNGFITSISIDSPGQGYVPATPQQSPYFTIAGRSAIPYGGGGKPWAKGTFDSNYFAGFFLGESLAAMLTADENPHAADYWDDFYHRVYLGYFKPWFIAYRNGGGYQEGFANYSEWTQYNYTVPLLLMKLWKGIDAVREGITWPLDNLDYMMYATYPSQDFVFQINAGYPWQGGRSPTTGYAPYAHYENLYGLGKELGHPRVAEFHRFTKEVEQALQRHSWGLFKPNAAENFLWWKASDPDADYTKLPLHYLSQGTYALGHLFVRSDWTRNAIWMGYDGGTFTDSNGEEYPYKGQPEIIKGGDPLIVSACGWLYHVPKESRRICMNDWHDGDVRPRILGNNFQLATQFGSQSPMNQFYNVLPPGVGPYHLGSDNPTSQGTARIVGVEDNATYFTATNVDLGTLYRLGKWNPVLEWTRQITYLRESRQFIFYDRTTVASPEYDQALAWHTASAPALSKSGTTNIEDISNSGHFTGRITHVLPVSAEVTVSDVGGLHSVYRAVVRHAGCDTSGKCATPPPTTERWLTVMDLNDSPEKAWTATPLSDSTGKLMMGVLLTRPDGRKQTAVLSAVASYGAPTEGVIEVSLDTRVDTMMVAHELQPNTRYAVQCRPEVIVLVPSAHGGALSARDGTVQFQSRVACGK